MNYKHTQIGYLIISLLTTFTLFFLIILFQTGFDNGLLIIIATLLFIVISFSTLTVTVGEKKLKIKFGYGIFRKTFLISEIVSVKKVKNKWYYGWGIRVWFWPYIWIYNISGYDAVEIKMDNGRIYRIGTDDVKNLEKTILEKLKK